MKRILIADDEQPILTGLKLLIKKYHAEDFSVIAEAHNGREAVELAEETAPDIILIDVQMPGLNGLEAIETISRRGIPAAFVLITAFERFEIAREALKLGVCDYILKPVSRERLELALNTAVLHLEKLEYFRRKEMEYAEKGKQLSGILRDNFFYSIRNNTVTKEQVYGFKAATELGKDYAFMLILALSGGDASLAPALARHMQYKTDAIPFASGYEGSSVYLVPLREKSEPAADGFVAGIASEFARASAAGELTLYRGHVVELADLPRSWSKALQQRYRSFEPEGTSGWNRGIDRSFYEAAAAGQYRKASALILEAAVYAKENGLDDHGSFMRIGAMLVCFAAREAVPEPVFEQAVSQRDFEALWTAGNHEAFNNRLRLLLEDLSGDIGVPRSPLAAKTFSYIQNHFPEPISLESAASAFSISPVHLSRTMKEETGKGFARTLSETRLEHAKKMLSSSASTVKEVSLACGYQDPNYFSRAFKSYTGFTPAEYRQKEQSNEA